MTMFKIGDLVTLRSDPDTAMPIIGVMAGTAETRYQVFQNKQQATYYESQLRPLMPVGEPSLVSADDLRAHLTSFHLLSPSTAYLYSLRSGRVHFVPYQYRPVVRLIRADRPRLLIADEVGVGKTIEAGLIIKELRARTDISSVLVICPKALVTERKWFVEMKAFRRALRGARRPDAPSLSAGNGSGRRMARPLCQGHHPVLPLRFGPAFRQGGKRVAGQRRAARPRSTAQVRSRDR